MPYIQSTYQIEVWMDLPFEKARSHLAPWRVAAQEENGGTLVTCSRDSLEMFAAMLLSFNCRLEVRQPPALRDVFRNLAQLAANAAQAAASPESNAAQPAADFRE
jgi:predicted DNA-binding transcriptional regulator YafY